MTMLQSIGSPPPTPTPPKITISPLYLSAELHASFSLSLSLSNPNCPFSSFQLLPTIRRLISLHVSITIIFLHHRLSLLPHEIDFYKISFLGFSTHTYTLSKFLPKTRYRRKFFSSTSELPLCGFSTIKGFVMN
ncbi:hypothetical protein L2E82_00808 [Cichorium intybus]|uniref:Uncharacterized protein n=1 Tax=Cichorium intybus TaxID=13427 RepID=A0ACB9GZI6_CICIN|nr:hypothetical protein L2E82_00808 [Cichorium intybus]